ncbi:MAG: hypothetical protein ACREBC_21935, partial [Pyrinomonadaceae bacterium]
ELEQLRFANRALVEFEIPPLRSSISGGNLLRLPPLNSTLTLKRLYSQKISKYFSLGCPDSCSGYCAANSGGW